MNTKPVRIRNEQSIGHTTYNTKTKTTHIYNTSHKGKKMNNIDPSKTKGIKNRQSIGHTIYSTKRSNAKLHNTTLKTEKMSSNDPHKKPGE